MLSSYYIPHALTDAYKVSIFSGLLDSPQRIGNTTMTFLLLFLPSLSVSTVLPSSEILDGDFPAPQCWPSI